MKQGAGDHSYFELHAQAELFQQRGGHADEIARMAARQGASVLRIARLLIELFEFPAEEALSIATCAVYGPRPHQPVGAMPRDEQT